MPDHQTVEKRDFFSLLATALVSFAGILSETSMNVTFPHLSKVFGLGLGTLQWITTGYLLAVAITITLGATLAHNWKERTILFTALANSMIQKARNQPFLQEIHFFSLLYSCSLSLQKNSP